MKKLQKNVCIEFNTNKEEVEFIRNFYARKLIQKLISSPLHEFILQVITSWCILFGSRKDFRRKRLRGPHWKTWTVLRHSTSWISHSWFWYPVCTLLHRYKNTPLQSNRTVISSYSHRFWNSFKVSILQSMLIIYDP